VLLYTNVRGLFSRIISNATWNNDGRGEGAGNEGKTEDMSHHHPT